MDWVERVSILLERSSPSPPCRAAPLFRDAGRWEPRLEASGRREVERDGVTTRFASFVFDFLIDDGFLDSRVQTPPPCTMPTRSKTAVLFFRPTIGLEAGPARSLEFGVLSFFYSVETYFWYY